MEIEENDRKEPTMDNYLGSYKLNKKRWTFEISWSFRTYTFQYIVFKLNYLPADILDTITCLTKGGFESSDLPFFPLIF